MTDTSVKVAALKQKLFEAVGDSIKVDPSTATAADRHVAAQDAARGDWPTIRHTEVPNPPWPNYSNPMLRYLVELGTAQIQAGAPVELVLMYIATNAWYEGGIEGYDHAHREVLTTTPTTESTT